MRGDFFLFFHGHIVADIGRKEKPCFLFFAAAYTGMSLSLIHISMCIRDRLLLGRADGIGHLAAVVVDHLHILLRDGGGAVQHDGEAGQTLGDFLQNVEAQRGRNKEMCIRDSA